MRAISTLLLCLAAGAAQAATVAFVGERGGGCVDVSAGSPTHGITLTTPVAAGHFLVIAAATTANITYLGTTDSGGNTYTADNSRFNDPFRTFTISAPVGTGLINGSTLTVAYSNISGTQQSCLNLAEFQNVATPGSVDVTGSNDSGAGTGTSLSAALGSSTTQPNALLFANFAIAVAGGSGGISVPPPFQPLNLRCTASNTFCLIPAYRVVSVQSGYVAAATTGNPVSWAGVITAYKDATFPVHLSGFEVE